MTLTSLLPTLRDSIPSPFDTVAWPARSRPTPDDVVIAGVSLLRIVELCQTPCVYTGGAVIPLSGGVESPTESTTVIICSVLDARPGRIRIDAVLGGHHPSWTEARLIGRISHAYDVEFSLEDATGTPVSDRLTLPADVRVGDLIAVPCAGCFSVGDVRPAKGTTPCC